MSLNSSAATANETSGKLTEPSIGSRDDGGNESDNSTTVASNKDAQSNGGPEKEMGPDRDAGSEPERGVVLNEVLNLFKQLKEERNLVPSSTGH
jgi:hypothetical protein